MRSALRSGASLLGTFAIVVGVPILLWRVGAFLVPAHLPTLHEALAALFRPDDGSLLMSALLAVGVLVWAQLSLSIVAEIVAELRHRPRVRVELPGLGASRLLASILVAGILGVGSATTAVAAQPVAAVVALDHSDVRREAVWAGQDLPRYVVQPRDSLWRIAAARLGDPLRWREIYDLNREAVQADGSRLTEATLLQAGWTLMLPLDAALSDTTVVVQPHDTLTGIAERTLHDPGRAREIFSINAGRPQIDGQRLADPNVIHPNWRLTVPPTPKDHPAAQPTGRPRPIAPSCTPTPAPLAPPRSPAAIPSPTTGAPSPTDSGAAESALPAVIGGSALVLAGALGALTVRRRRQQRHRRFRHEIAVPDDVIGRREWQAATNPPALDTSTLDAALRALALHDWAGIAAPDLMSVSLTANAATLRLAKPVDPPTPFASGADASTWTLIADTKLPLTTTEAGGYCAPFPLLVSIASAGERALLVDLEQMAYVTVTGETTAAIGLLRHVAAELANARWSDDVEILLVGFGDELVPLNPDRLRPLPDLAAALNELRVCRKRIAATRAATATSVVHGRLSGLAPDGWLPVVLLIADSTLADETDRVQLRQLADFAEDDRAGFAVLVHDTEVNGTEIHVTDEGELLTPTAGSGPWTAEMMSTVVAAGVAGILAPTAAPDQPVGPARHPEPWATDMDADGGLSIAHPSLPVPDSEAQRRLEVVDKQDPHLNRDLAIWLGDTAPRPMIAILGDPIVRAPGEHPRTRTSWFIEVLVYLALHPAGVTQDKALTDLWPDGRRINAATVRSAFYHARRWAGRGLDGDSDRSFVSDLNHDHTYRLRGHLLDFDLFRRLRKRAQARHGAGHPGAVGDYEAALGLIRGPVLSGLRPSGYAWLNNHDQRHDLQIPGFLVDTAHELVDIALAAQNTAVARWAAETARSIDIDTIFDRPLTDLMRVAHAEGQTSEMERYARVLLDARDADVAEDLPHETFLVLDQLMPAGPRPARRASV